MLIFKMLTSFVALIQAILYLALRLTLKREIPEMWPSNPGLPSRTNTEDFSMYRDLKESPKAIPLHLKTKMDD